MDDSQLAIDVAMEVEMPKSPILPDRLSFGKRNPILEYQNCEKKKLRRVSFDYLGLDQYVRQETYFTSNGVG